MFRNYHKSIAIFLLLALTSTAPAFAKKKGENKKEKAAQSIGKRKKKGADKENTPKVCHYDTLVNNNTKISNGLLRTIQKGNNYYFEIPDSLLGKEMLVVNKLQKVPAELNEAGVNKGINTDHFMIRFEKDLSAKKITIRQVRPKPSYPKGDAIGLSVEENFISPLIAQLPIEAFSKDSSSFVVKVNDFFNGEKTSLNNIFNDINLGTSSIKELSKILSVKSFANNVVAYSELTTKVTEGQASVQITVEVSTSIVLLPDHPMTGRFTNQRVGFFSVNQSYFSDRQQSVENKKLITRWRLEPKEADRAAYLKGEIVEPAQPIVFYIDRSTPYQWRTYMKKGVEDWQKAFEKAGFKNAIIAKELSDSADIDADDVSFSVINYVASQKVNAMGPSISDPRSGEIIEADIIWWHNVLSMLQKWITVQTGTVDPAVRSVVLPDSIMGNAIRFVACHEVGHSLGLRHNMMGSFAFATDSLRSKSFTDRMNSTSSSIMDYARYNYVAQPGDQVTCLSPHIGPYDQMAIEFGYRWSGKSSPFEERAFVDSLLQRYQGQLYAFSEQQDPRAVLDPRAQSEDLGDDPVRASEYGIANLQKIVPQIVDWTTTGELQQDYTEAGRLIYAVINQWNNYLYHCLANIGGIYLDNVLVGENQPSYRWVEKEKQVRSLHFLIKEILTYPTWLFDASVYQYTYPLQSSPFGFVEVSPALILKNAQSYLLWDLLDNTRLIRMFENEATQKEKGFSPLAMMDQLHAHVFGPTEKGLPLTIQQRQLQKGLVDALILGGGTDATTKSSKKMMDERLLSLEQGTCCRDNHLHSNQRNVSFIGSQALRISDAVSLKRGELQRVIQLLKKSIPATSDKASKYHYQDLLLRITEALNIQK